MAVIIDGAGTITGITEGGLNDGIITENELVAAVTPIGVGQTWQNPSRATGVTFTNSTGRPIAVSINVEMDVPVLAQLLVDGGVRAWQQAGGTRHNVFVIVPNGSNYQLVVNFGSFISLSWGELR